jgi:hypothetical protein
MRRASVSRQAPRPKSDDTRRRRLPALGLLLLAATFMTVAVAASGATAGDTSAQLRKPVYSGDILEAERTGVSAPVGIAFSGAKRAFYVVGGRGEGDASATDVVELTPFSHVARSDRAGSVLLGAALSDPINMAFDAKSSRLLFIDGSMQLVAARVSAVGRPDPASLRRFDLSALGLDEPEGVALDQSTGTLFVLDAAGPRIVEAVPAADGSYPAAGVSSIDLAGVGAGGMRGLALDPSARHLYVRAGESVYELTLQGDVVAAYDLTGAGLVHPDGLVLAPSSDRTDLPSQQSLYVADSRGETSQSTGRIVEVSLAVAAQASIDFTSSLVRTVNTATWSPASPDPSGIEYLPGPDRLMISDGEVEETVGGITHFQGANVWETTRAGNVIRTANISRVPPTVVPMTNEPTGVAFDPHTGLYYFSDDGAKKVHILNPGADGLVGTSDDTFSQFSTVAENDDPEGITFDAFGGHLFVVDGLNREVYEYTTGGGLLNHFDVLQYGIVDPEGIQFNPVSGTLFVLSNDKSGTGTQTLVAEVTRTGSLVQTIDLSSASIVKPADIAYAPASDGSGAKRFYVVDRGIDNNTDPNAVDGRMYELTAPVPQPPTNLPPTASAGPDQTVALPGSATLDGTITDDGKPAPPGAVSASWSQISGPGVINFGNPGSIDTTASASVSGVYVVRLTASDGQYAATDDTTLVFTGSGGLQSFDGQISVGADDAEEAAATNAVVIGNGDLDMMVGDEGNLVVGLRFRGVAVPKGAQITNAYVQFQADEAQSGATSLTIKGQADDNAATFTTAAGSISSRPTTAAAASWAPPAWLGVGDAGLAQRTSNIAGVLQEIVNRSGWAPGNALVLLVTGTGTRVAESYNGSSTGAPRLHVEWSGGSGGAPPLITSDGGGDTASRSVAENQTAVTTVTATDPDSSSLLYSIQGGADAARFSIGSASGVLTFRTAPDFEAPADSGGNNVYDVNVNVSDGQGGTDTQAIGVSVLNVDEFAPVITSNGGGATAAISMPENRTAVTTTTATDADGDPVSYLISGGADASAFTIDPSTGALAFTTPPDFENPSDATHDNVYEVTVAASDGSLNDDQALSVTVTDVAEGSNAPPTVGAGSDQTITLPSSASLTGSASDDGKPNGTLTTTWSKTSGPGSVTFGNANALSTSATFSQAGTYVLRLTASDGALSAFDELTVTVNPASGPDPIFSDGFESGSFSAWSSATTGGGDLSVSSAAAHTGTNGMQATVNDTSPLFVTDSSPASETRYRARFWFNPNGIVMAKNAAHYLLEGQNTSGTTLVRIELRWNGKAYQVRAAAAKDTASGFATTSWFTMTNAWHAIEIDWRASSAPGANSGGLTLWIDGVQSANLTGVDNDTRRIESARLGALDGIDAGTHGTSYFDDFVSRRQSYIGP